MARGWDSKSIESQIESAAAEKSTENKEPRSEAEIVKVREWEGLMLSRTRVLNQMEACSNPRYRLILDKALSDLESKLERLKLSHAAQSG